MPTKPRLIEDDTLPSGDCHAMVDRDGVMYVSPLLMRTIADWHQQKSADDKKWEDLGGMK